MGARIVQLLRLGAIRAAMVVASVAAGMAASTFANAADLSSGDCGPLRDVGTDAGGLLDYRMRVIDARVQAGINQVNRYHTEPARRALSVTPTNQSIIADLDFTLRHSPNHLEALRLLMEYERAGGRAHEYAKLECYLIWARQFVPGDMGVLQFTAQYYWKSGNRAVAEDLYAQALKAEPDSAELHYNAGLFYFSLKDYARAREHARVAYAGGFPLPGLRSMLERANQWTDPAAKNTPKTNP